MHAKGKPSAISYQRTAISATRTLREQLMGKVSASFAQRGQTRTRGRKAKAKACATKHLK
uniref:Uncharacterized protein n=1 Tax=Moorena producens (strain JHB) TaxID=1454205 RepID=A0A1D9FTU7_MOOP1